MEDVEAVINCEMMKNKLILQWHITSRCNKRCKHCYIEDYEDTELNIDNLLEIGQEYLKLLNEYNKINNCNLKGQINITGGEPFTYQNIWTLFDFFKEHEDSFDFAILTNGSYLNEETVKRLKTYSPKFVQISLDGNEGTHDDIRGKGSFKEVENALYMLQKYKIKSMVSFTANNSNYKEFSDVVKTARKYKAYKVWTDRMVPIGSSNKSDIDSLNSEMLKEYITIIRREKLKLINRFSKINIGGERSLHFLNGVSGCYKCNAGNGLIIILENGDVMPCRRLPLVCGNIYDKEKNIIIKDELKNIYFNSHIFKNLRNFIDTPIGCEKCSFINICGGGAKCISYGVYGDYKHGDFACPLKNLD